MQSFIGLALMVLEGVPKDLNLNLMVPGSLNGKKSLAWNKVKSLSQIKTKKRVEIHIFFTCLGNNHV